MCVAAGIYAIVFLRRVYVRESLRVFILGRVAVKRLITHISMSVARCSSARGPQKCAHTTDKYAAHMECVSVEA